MKTTKTHTQKITKVVTTCDNCGNTINTHYASNTRCYICERDICPSCTGYDEWEGDYLTRYCKECWKRGELIREKILKLEDEIEKLTDAWHEICKINPQPSTTEMDNVAQTTIAKIGKSKTKLKNRL